MADATYNPQPFVSNPMSSFDPTQWANPYSLFKGQALPWPSQYAGPPTDAFGNPIQSYVDANNTAQANYQQQLAAYNARPAAQPAAQPAATPTGTLGTSINSNPATAANPATVPLAGNMNTMWSPGGQMKTGPAAALAASEGVQGPGMPNRAQIDAMNAGNAYMQAGAQAGRQGDGWGSKQGAGNAAESAGWGYLMQNAFNQAQAPQQAAPAGPAPPTPPDMSAQYIRSLANPGPLRAVGANVPASSATTQPDSGVLQNFLANWQPQGGNGPGAGFTAAFSKALRGK